MDDRGYVAQALFDRLSREGSRFRILGRHQRLSGARARGGAARRRARSARRHAAPRGSLLPGARPAARAPCARGQPGVALRARVERRGRPAALHERAALQPLLPRRALLPARRGAPCRSAGDALRPRADRRGRSGELAPEAAAWLSVLWNEDPRGAAERISAFWPSSLATCAFSRRRRTTASGDPVRASLAALRRSLRRAVWPTPPTSRRASRSWRATSSSRQRASVAFLGRESPVRSEVLRHVARDLAPLGLSLFEAGFIRRAAPCRWSSTARTTRRHQDVSSRWTAPAASRPRWWRSSARSCAGSSAGSSAATRTRWWAKTRSRRAYCSSRCATASPLVQFFMNCSIGCRLGSPVLMPYPFGIVIEPGTRIGSRVTVMHQVEPARRSGDRGQRDHLAGGEGGRPGAHRPRRDHRPERGGHRGRPFARHRRRGKTTPNHRSVVNA